VHVAKAQPQPTAAFEAASRCGEVTPRTTLPHMADPDETVAPPDHAHNKTRSPSVADDDPARPLRARSEHDRPRRVGGGQRVDCRRVGFCAGAVSSHVPKRLCRDSRRTNRAPRRSDEPSIGAAPAVPMGRPGARHRPGGRRIFRRAQKLRRCRWLGQTRAVGGGCRVAGHGRLSP